MNICNVTGSVGMGGYPKTLKLPKILTSSKCHDNLHSNQISQEVLINISSGNLAPQCPSPRKNGLVINKSSKFFIQSFELPITTRATWSNPLKVEQREPFL